MTEDWKSAFQRQLLTLGASPLNAIRPLVAENLPRRLIRYRPPNSWTLAKLQKITPRDKLDLANKLIDLQEARECPGFCG
jgi:hypothetical protein